MAALVQRDVNGLYKKALAGELPHFTGRSDPYEPPTHPAVMVRSDEETVEESAAWVLGVMWERLETGKSGVTTASKYYVNYDITHGIERQQA